MKSFRIIMSDREHADLKLSSVFFEKSMNQIVRGLIREFAQKNRGRIKKALEDLRKDHEERL